ncbi:uncharacterized protein C8Q71DRAFT_857116 [Rhodofomes roseus]|uniref:Uncharacterized protein n=1 Tax=Rhodofomes roseus TaxID=34475 RepID=A0ABQ8KJJ4_9APHY|nr:uncharacterized protein C8Q71DRAFT_857116 [Rhodofomes roseus]KAH9837945.1 hypothetical protein C8Q71DRAFT_857116 [Rhodofomes roseus]
MSASSSTKHGAVNTPKKLRAATQSFKAMMGKIEPEEVFDSGDDYVPRPKQKPQPAKRGPPKHPSARAKASAAEVRRFIDDEAREARGIEGTDNYQDHYDEDIVELSDEEDDQQEIADVATIVSSDDEPVVSTKGHASTSRLRRRRSILEMSRSSPDWDTDLVGSTPDSPIKRANLTGPPDSPATPSPSKDKVRAKRIERPSPVADEEESLKASPTKKSRTTVNKGKGKAKAVVLSDAEDNPFIAGTSNKEAVFIGGKQLDTVIEIPETLKRGKQPSGKDRDDAAGVPGAVYMMPKLELFPPTGNEHCKQLDKDSVEGWLENTYADMWPMRKHDVPEHAFVETNPVINAFQEHGIYIHRQNFKRTIQWSFTGNWLVNPACASPKNFSASLPGYTRPVITFNGNPIINFTLGLVEFSYLMEGNLDYIHDKRSKYITITPFAVELDLAWGFWCEVLGQGDLMLGSFKRAEGYMSFNTLPAKISDESQSRPSYSRKSFVDLTKVVKSPMKDKVSSPSASKHPKSRSRPAEISSSQVAVSSNQKIPIWDARHYFEQQEAPVFDIETIAANCPIVEKEPAHHSVVAVLHTVSTYGRAGEPTNLSLNVVGVVILVGNEARGN